MKKVLSVLLVVVMLFAMVSVVSAEPISPEADVNIKSLIIIKIGPNGEEIREEIPADEIGGYYRVRLPSECENDEEVQEFLKNFYPEDNYRDEAPGEDMARTFGEAYRNYTFLAAFMVDRIGTPKQHDFVELEVYISWLNEDNINEFLKNNSGLWDKIDVISIKDGILKFRASYENAPGLYSVIYQISEKSPATGVADNSVYYLIPVAFLMLGVCAYSTKKYILD